MQDLVPRLQDLVPRLRPGTETVGTETVVPRLFGHRATEIDGSEHQCVLHPKSASQNDGKPATDYDFKTASENSPNIHLIRTRKAKGSALLRRTLLNMPEMRISLHILLRSCLPIKAGRRRALRRHVSLTLPTD